MEKFTRLFLLGEHSVVRFLRKIGLGLALVLWTTLAFAQEAQDTYHLKVGSYDNCYRIDNIYTIPVTMKDFNKIMKFNLKLEYTGVEDFDFIGLTKVNPKINTLPTTKAALELTDGVLTFDWQSATPVTIEPDNTDNLLFVLNFKVVGFQHQYLNANKFEFGSTLTWKQVDLYNVDGQCEILTEMITNGAIKVTEKWQSVVLDYAVAKCAGGVVTATVTTPAKASGMLYSFNGNDYNSTEKTEVTAPSTNNLLVIKDATCISYVKKFDVTNIKPVSFTAATPVEAVCPGGLGDIEIIAKDGSSPYTYYVIPEEQWSAGDNMATKLLNGDVSLLSKYTYANYVIQVPAGVYPVYKKYHVAVQDANGCASITGSYMNSWWKDVEVTNKKGTFDLVPTADMDLMTTCYGQPDGRISFEVVGGTPWTDGYNISLGGKYITRSFTYDSNVYELCEGKPCMHAVLKPGVYEFTISDQNGCSYTESFEVKQPKKIVFDANHKDAGCDQAVGEIWVENITGGTGSNYVWYYTTDPTWATDVKGPFSATTKATNVPAGVYYVKVADENGCEQEWTNPKNANDNALKVLTTVFDIVYTPIKCWGDVTTVTVTLVSGDANHTFNYKLEWWNGFSWVVIKDWQTSNQFANIHGDWLYRYSVKDLTANNCVVSWMHRIPNPMKLNLQVLDYNTRPPSCPDNNDGNISVMAIGGRPWGKTQYQFAIDDRPFRFASEISNFAVGGGEHTITVKDSAGCTDYVKVRLPITQNLINFVDTIPVACKNDSVNLFNAWPQNDKWWNSVGLDKGYMLWYNWYLWENHLGDDEQYSKIAIWTSANGWEEVPFQGNIYSRNPKLYISQKPWVTKSDIVTKGLGVVGHDSHYGAGRYFVVAKDEWGCYSNVDTIDIIEPKPLEVILSTTDAGCFNTWTGVIKVEAFNGRFPIPSPAVVDPKYQYVLVQQPDIFNQPNWYGTQVQWIDFKNENDWKNDSTLLISVKEGKYWLAIRDYCSLHDPSQIIILNEIVIGGKADIKATVTVNDVLCYGDKNGSIVVTGATGGFGDYTYELNLIQAAPGSKWPTGTKWPFTNKTGVFSDLYGGKYKVVVKDPNGCKPYEEIVTVVEPGKLALSLKGVDASCYGAQDGILRYAITGGTAPFKESTNNGLNWYVIAEKTRTFDRRAGAGTYDVMIMDANGCTATNTITLLQPGKLEITKTTSTKVSCPPAQAKNCKTGNQVSDGTIKVYWSGGWNAVDVFKYYITATKGEDVRTLEADVTSSTTFVTFTGLDAGDWVIKVWEHSYKTIPYDKPYIMDPNYATNYASGFVPTRPDALPNPQQNPDITVCLATTTVNVGAPAPITYDVEYLPLICKDTDSGEIHVHNVAGGTGPYFFCLEGPSGSGYIYGDWKPAVDGAMEYLFTKLPWGHYNVFIKDSKGCVVCLESGEINNVKGLDLIIKLVKNADCYDTATGQVKIDLETGKEGPVGYKLEYAVALASEVEQYLFPLDDDNFVKNLKWQDSNIFNVKSGVWIGYVKATEQSNPSRGYCVAGHSTDKAGVRILNHRVFVDQPTEVKGYVWDKLSVKALCYGDANGKIKVSDVWGGSGVGYSAHVFGTAFDGTAVSKWYSDVEKGDFLEGLLASTDKKDTTKMVAADFYNVVFLDSKGCMSKEYQVSVQQPEKFEIELVLKQDAFICPEDLAGVFEIRVVSGGTGTIVYKYEAWDGTTLKLSSPYGAINTFQGPAGLLYKGWAMDANGCVAYAEKFVAKPVVASFEVFDRTCFGDASASAIVKLKVKDPARKYMVSYQKYPSTTWSAWSAEFVDSIKVTGLTYGDYSTDLGHYKFRIKDNMNCQFNEVLVTFVPIQTELKTCCATVVPGECTGTLSITITGGVTPYTVFVDGKLVTGAAWTLPAGAHVVKVVDAHLCVSELPVTIDANPVERTASAVAYIGETVKFTDAEAGIDKMLAKGVHTFKYTFTNGCERTLVVTVTEQYRTATIAEIQGTGEISPLKDLPRQITGTVTAVVPGVGYFVQDGRDAVNGRCGIFVADTKTVVLENTGVKVGGIVKELNDVTTLEAAVVEVVQGAAYEPILLASPADGKNEKWESVLVKVEGTRFQGTVNPDGSWVIKTQETNNIVVNDWMFSYVPVDGHYFTVTGVINGANSLYKLEPRKLADVIDLTKTTPVIDPANLQFNVYPNPFNDQLTITNADRLSRVTITNIAGQRVMDIQYPDGVIRTSNLVSGVYVITLFTEDGIAKAERMVKR